ncbi:MAG: S9 family peptidase [Chloroflexi bacterium]|nr:S9 family peptidase [Chloroflexota bacterium]
MPKKSPQAITIEQAVDLKLVSDAQISPGGKLVAFTVADTFKVDTKRPRSQIWVGQIGNLSNKPFTTGVRTDNTPRWSPDGSTLAFLSDRIEDGKPQIYLISLGGSEAHAITEAKGNILDLQWSHDGKRIAFLMEDAETDEEKKRKQSKDDAIEFEKHPKYVRVWIVDVATRETRQVTQGDIHVWEFEWSPNDRDFVLLVSDAPFEYEWYRPRFARVTAKGGEPETIFTPTGGKQLALARWSPNGKQIAFISCIWSDRGVVSGDIWLMNADGSNARNFTANSPRDYSDFYWTPDGKSLITMGYESGDAAIGILNIKYGDFHQVWRGEAGFLARFWQHFTLTRDQSTLAVVREDSMNPPDVWIAKIKKTGLVWKQLSRVNPQTSYFKIGETEKIYWRSSDGAEMQGYIVKPIGYRAGKRYPMVTWVHGGPAGNFGARYYAIGHRIQFLAAKGFMVFLPNPRGSLGWGTAFTESNVGDMGGMDWQDIMTGVDYCIAHYFVDENKLGLAGWSYGGFMTSWGITQTDRFKAAMVGAAITNWLSFHGTSNLSVWDQIANNACPYERGNAYDKFSPMNFVARVKTPTLVIHGEIDPYVPVSQGYEFYRALKDQGVPVEMMVYPRESHGFVENNHVIDLNKRIVAWFVKYLTAD